MHATSLSLIIKTTVEEYFTESLLYHKSAVIYKYKGEPGLIHFVSYSDFTVNSCDYFLSQPGLFSAKLTPELVHNEGTRYKVATFQYIASLVCTHFISAHVHWG